MTKRNYVDMVHQMRTAQQRYRINRSDANRKEAKRLVRLVDTATKEMRSIPEPSVLIELRQGRDPLTGMLTGHRVSQIIVTHPIKLLQVLDLLTPLCIKLMEVESEYPGEDFSELPDKTTTHSKSDLRK